MATQTSNFGPNPSSLEPATSFSPSVALRVNLGPLTTTFTPPVSCGPMICSSSTSAALAQTCHSEYGMMDNPTCWPSPTGGVYGVAPLNSYGIYSPGYICPANYTSACTQSFGTSDPRFTFQYPLRSGEIAVGCCPTGFTCTNPDPDFNSAEVLLQTCVAVLTSTTFAAVACYPTSGTAIWTNPDLEPSTFLSSSITVLLPVPPYISSGNISSVTIPLSIYAPLIQLVYQASDLDAHHIPSREIAGIIIGSLIGFTFLLALIWFLLRCKHRRKKGDDNGRSAADLWPKAELSGRGKPLNEVSGETEVRELATENMYECPHPVQELEAPDVVHELHDGVLVQESTGRESAELRYNRCELGNN